MTVRGTQIERIETDFVSEICWKEKVLVKVIKVFKVLEDFNDFNDFNNLHISPNLMITSLATRRVIIVAWLATQRVVILVARRL